MILYILHVPSSSQFPGANVALPVFDEQSFAQAILETKDHLLRGSGHSEVINIHGQDEDVFICVLVKDYMLGLTVGKTKLVHDLVEVVIPLASGLLDAT